MKPILNYGVRYIFTNDYKTSCRSYTKGTICNTLNGVVVLGENNEFLFDVDSKLSRKHGLIVSGRPMQMDLILCLESCQSGDEMIALLQADFDISEVNIDNEDVLTAKIIINNVTDLQQLGLLLDDDIIIEGANMDILTHKYALKEMGW